jgi:hypothetical protein
MQLMRSLRTTRMRKSFIHLWRCGQNGFDAGW